MPRYFDRQIREFESTSFEMLDKKEALQPSDRSASFFCIKLCGDELVGHVHGGAGAGADGLASRLLDGTVDDGVQLDGLIGARLGGNVLKQVARLALEHFANALHGGETHGLDATATHTRNVHRRDVDALREFVDGHLAIRHHSVETRNNRHNSSLTRFRR